MNVVNLTPHAINLYEDDLSGSELLAVVEPSGKVARCKVEKVETGEISYINGKNSRTTNNMSGVKLYKTVFGEVADLPDPVEGTIYIVSMLVRQAVPHRDDLYSPGELIRNEAGQPIGCYGLTR